MCFFHFIYVTILWFYAQCFFPMPLDLYRILPFLKKKLLLLKLTVNCDFLSKVVKAGALGLTLLHCNEKGSFCL